MATLKRGSRGEDVKALQEKLNLYPDGIFGSLTEEAVKEFQKQKGLSVDGIAGPKTLAALGIVQTNKRYVDQIILHYSATPDGEDYDTDFIRRCHLQRGFSDIGYHWVIYRDGSVHPGRSEALAGAHCTDHNTRSIGVCYIGGCPPRNTPNWANIGMDTRTPAQKAALISLLMELKARYPNATIHGHNEFAAKPCPGFNAREEYKSL